MEQEKEIYLLGMWASFGELMICGVYTSGEKLIEGYQRMMDGNVRCWPYSDDDPCPREAVIYKFPANEFIAETPEWNDGKLYSNECKYEISIKEVQEKMNL